MKHIETDCLVIGSGVAGSIYAMEAAKAGLDVTLITGEDELNKSNSLWAQGGIIYDNQDKDLFLSDLSVASSNTSNPKTVETLVNEGSQIVKDLLIEELQVPFDRDKTGKLKLTREASHSHPRIIFSKDRTGRTILNSLHKHLYELAAKGNLKIRTGELAVDLLTPSHSSMNYFDKYYPLRCVGAYVLDTKTNQVNSILSKKTILATGGIGQIYLHTTNSLAAHGHGIAMAYRVGARIIDMEYVQFHPTVFHKKGDPPFLISEAIRGEGGILVNHSGEAFMENYHSMGSLAPRDIIARSIHTELLKSNSESVYIDLSKLKKSYIEKRFPTIYYHLKEAGIDMTTEPIPVVPAAHYSCGGVHSDINGNTNIKNLSVIGEAACTGIHGANRLASTSLLECVVMGFKAAQQHYKEINISKDYYLPKVLPWIMPDNKADNDLITQDLNLIRNTMWNYVGLVRTTKRLERASNILRELKNEVDNFYADNHLTPQLISLRNAIQTARLVTYAAFRNKKSVGSHFRDDTLDHKK